MRVPTLLLTTLFCCLSFCAVGKTPSRSEFEQALENNLSRVEEFRYAKALADSMGIRVYLFGGTAAGFGHYQREALLAPSDRFDFDYTNIYRSTQDADLVIDGTSEQAELFEQKMAAQFNHLQGSKSVWEVRTLHTARENKAALLANADFLRQHTDSNSVGLIEITTPKENEPRVQDLTQWNKPDNLFFESIRSGTIDYYFSPSHTTTTRFTQGNNPPIFSVIRFLTKAFQYGLEISEKDMRTLHEIVSAFRASHDLSNEYTRTWIEKNAVKLFLNSRDVERSWTTLERLGLRTKLIAIGDPATVGSMAWWLNKEPLRSKPVGQGDGQTAKVLGIDVVAHETRSMDQQNEEAAFRAFEGITSSPEDLPNVFISRGRMVGEAAVHGDGFYVRIGREGAVGTGYTIRFRLDPDAREGSDFLVAHDYLVILNRKAISIIREEIRKTPLEYLQMLNELGLASSDRAIMHQFERRIVAKATMMSENEAVAIRDFIVDSADQGQFVAEAFSAALRFLVAANHAEHVTSLMGVALEALSSPDEKMAKAYGRAVLAFLRTEESLNNPDLLLRLIEKLPELKLDQRVQEELYRDVLPFQLRKNRHLKVEPRHVQALVHVAVDQMFQNNVPYRITTVGTLTALAILGKRDEIRDLLDAVETDAGAERHGPYTRLRLKQAILSDFFSQPESVGMTDEFKQYATFFEGQEGERQFYDHVLPHHLAAFKDDIDWIFEKLIFNYFTGPVDGVARRILRIIREKEIEILPAKLRLLKWMAQEPGPGIDGRILTLFAKSFPTRDDFRYRHPNLSRHTEGWYRYHLNQMRAEEERFRRGEGKRRLAAINQGLGRVSRLVQNVRARCMESLDRIGTLRYLNKSARERRRR